MITTLVRDFDMADLLSSLFCMLPWVGITAILSLFYYIDKYNASHADVSAFVKRLLIMRILRQDREESDFSSWVAEYVIDVGSELHKIEIKPHAGRIVFSLILWILIIGFAFPIVREFARGEYVFALEILMFSVIYVVFGYLSPRFGRRIGAQKAKRKRKA